MPTAPFPTGTFLQCWLAASYPEGDLDQAFQWMADAGVRDLIVQTTLDEFDEVTKVDKDTPPKRVPTAMYALYPSKIPNVTVRGGRDTVRMILERAKRHRMRVFLGLNLYHQAWFYDFDRRPFVNDRNWCGAEADRGNAVAKELHAKYKTKFPDTFYGWYWAWEVDNSAAINRENVARMMNANFDRLRQIDASIPILISSFYNAELGSPAEHGAFWTQLLSEVPSFGAGDIFAPQDGIGPSHVSVDESQAWFQALKAAVETKDGLTLWANCETFHELCEDREVDECPGEKVRRVSAPLRRVVRQYEAVAPHVEKIVTFAYPHYDSPLKVNPAFHKAWITYQNTGALNDAVPPTPGSLTATKGAEGAVVLSWAAHPGPNGDSGFVVWCGGTEIRRVEIPPEPRVGVTTISIEDRTASGAHSRYEVVAFDAIGNHSARTTVTGP